MNGWIGQMQFEHKKIIVDIKDDYKELLDFENYRIGVFSSRCKTKTSQENEDSVFLSASSQKVFLGVADGAGGHPRGRDASFTVADFVFRKPNDNCIDMIEDINRAILDLKVGAKTTLAMMTIQDEMARFYSVGDSEIIHWNSQGAEVYKSTPHSSTGLKIEAGITSQEESLHDPDRYIVNNLLGDEYIKIETTNRIPIKKGHTVLIGTDGLFDNLTHEELNQVIANGNFDNAFEDLVNICIKRYETEWLKDDDIGFVVVKKIKA